MNNKFLVIVVFMSLIGMSNSSQALPVAVTDVSGLELFGFDGIEMLNGTWNVRFVEGSYTSIFGGNNGLDFTNISDSITATNALLSTFSLPQHLVFDENPNMTHGIEHNRIALIMTPYTAPDANSVVSTASAYNQNLTGSDRLHHYDWQSNDSTVAFYTLIVADWTRVSNVPVPTAVWFMGAGLISLMGFSRKRSQISKVAA